MMPKKIHNAAKATHPTAPATTSTAATPIATTPATQVTSVANSKNTGSKAALQTSFVALIAGLQASFASDYVFELPMGNQTTRQLVAMLQQFVQAAESTKSSYQSWRNDVQAERQVEQAVTPVRAAIKLVLQGRFGKSSNQLLPYGFLPQKVVQKTALSKAVATVKNEATRKARGTVGAPAPAAKPSGS